MKIKGVIEDVKIFLKVKKRRKRKKKIRKE